MELFYMTHQYKIAAMTDSSISEMISDTKLAINRIREEISRLEEEIKKGNNTFEYNTDEKAVWWLRGVLQMKMTDEQKKINAPKVGESYYQWFIPIKYESYVGTPERNKIEVFVHRNSDHVHDEVISNRQEGFLHPNVRANTVFNDSSVVSNKYKAYDLSLMIIRKTFPQEMLRTNENAIAVLKSIIYLYKEGKYGNFKRNNKHIVPERLPRNESLHHISHPNIDRIVESVVHEYLHGRQLNETTHSSLSFYDNEGGQWDAVASFKNGNSTGYIVEDDGCYLIYTKGNKGYWRSEYIFPEAYEALKKLPNPCTLD